MHELGLSRFSSHRFVMLEICHFEKQQVSSYPFFWQVLLFMFLKDSTFLEGHVWGYQCVLCLILIIYYSWCCIINYYNWWDLNKIVWYSTKQWLELRYIPYRWTRDHWINETPIEWVNIKQCLPPGYISNIWRRDCQVYETPKVHEEFNVIWF